MDRLCDDVLHLIFDRLDYPGDLAIVNKRFYAFSQDPYVRAHYFMYRYGAVQALYHAFGRGKVLNERVLEILISSGARFSRYLVQVAFHHYFHTRSHFIKTSWVRSVPLPVFNHFLKLATDAYGDIPRGKTEDDGTVFTWFLQQTPHVDSKRVNWETARDLLDKYKFIPFCDRDPLMSQFPLALALEPRLLPYAVSNGFVMDAKYRNFIFRKMFEKAPDRTADRIVENIRELSKLDSAMFVSCTVAAEVCMEATSNAHGYMALKELSASHNLIFDLRILVEDLMKQFYKPRAITHRDTQDVLRHLYRDFPSPDPSVRLVMLLTVFLPGNVSLTVSSLRDQLAGLKLSPITKNDLRNLLISPWMEDFEGIVSYMRKEVLSDVTGRKGMLPVEISALMDEVALRCLEIGCKGRTLKKLSSIFPTVRNAIIIGVEQHNVDLDNLRTEGTRRRARYRLCRTWYQEGDDRDYFWDRAIPAQDRRGSSDVEDLIPASSRQYLGPIGQESLSTMIRQEESTSQRSRRRITIEHTVLSTMTHSPFDQTHVGKWVKQEFGPRHSVTATFLTHAIINENTSILNDYLRPERQTDTVPLTLQHFQFLARLSKAPSYLLYRYIERGGEFFKSEEDYLYPPKTPLARTEVKRESLTPPKISKPSSSSRKRPRRSTAPIVRSYADFDGCGDDPMDVERVTKRTPVLKPVDAHLRLWIKHLRELLKIEQVQHLENKKSLLEESEPGAKVRVSKNEFFKSLETNLRALRKLDTQRHQETLCAPDMSCSDFEDDEDYVKAGKSKRRKTTAP